jgi:glucose-1-phosphate thymidylyltransferase
MPKNKRVKGIILAGGSGTRLYPCTKSITKQLLPVYNKPMIYYPLSVLMMAEIQDILIIASPQDKHSFENLFGDGSQFGINITYTEQQKPEGIAQAFLIAEECGFANGNESLALILGDNIFHGEELLYYLSDAKYNILESGSECATIFGYEVNDPSRYGVAEIDEEGNCISIEEKPNNPKSNYAVVGLYFYPEDVISKAKALTPSKRNELEITDLNKLYLDENRLDLMILPKGTAWFDSGTFDSLLEASNYVSTIENHQHVPVGDLKHIAEEKEWI